MANPGQFSLEAMLRNAFALSQAGRLDDAARAAKGILKLQPKEPNALYLLGIVAHQQGDTKAAGQWFEKCHRADRNNVGALSGLGILRMDQGRFNEALKFFQRVLEKMPGDAATLNNMGLVNERLGNYQASIDYYRKSVQSNPAYATARLNFGKALADIGQTTEARQQYEEGLRHAPGMAELHGNYANLLCIDGEHERALKSFSDAIRLNPQDIDVRVNMANAYLDLGQTDDAKAVLEEARKISPDHPGPVLDLAEIAESEPEDGKARAKSLYETAVSIADDYKKSKSLTPQTTHRLGRAFDKLGRHEDAFSCWQSAHGQWKEHLNSSGIRYDASETRAMADGIVDFFDAHSAPPDHAYKTETKPIFIVGMMRSGTSLLEQVLSSHSDIDGAGELMDMPHIVEELAQGHRHWTDALKDASASTYETYARRYLDTLESAFPKAKHVVDKLPANFLNVGLIRFLFPSALIVHTRRNPVDTCLSVFMQKFSSNITFGHDLIDIGQYYRAYRELMGFWHSWDPNLCRVDYEEMVADPKLNTAPLLERLGLEWESTQDRFYETERAVKTASRLQVRQPVYKSSVERWRRYETQLGPLLDELGNAAAPWHDVNEGKATP